MTVDSTFHQGQLVGGVTPIAVPTHNILGEGGGVREEGPGLST